MNVAAHEDQQKAADEGVEGRVERSFAEAVHDAVVDDDWQIDHSEEAPENCHNDEGSLLEIAVAEVDADFADIHWDIDDVVEDHDAHTDDLDIEDEAGGDHDDGDHVVEEEDRPVAIGPEEADVDKVVGDKEHEVDFLEACEDADGSLLEIFGTVHGVEWTKTIWAVVDGDCAHDARGAVVDHVEATVNELFGIFRFDELGNALEHQVSDEETVDCVDNDDAEEDWQIIPINRRYLMQEVHSDE